MFKLLQQIAGEYASTYSLYRVFNIICKYQFNNKNIDYLLYKKINIYKLSCINVTYFSPVLEQITPGLPLNV